MGIMTECTQAFDNKVLLADGGGNVAKFDDAVITYVGADEKRYMFPKDDIVFLPVKEVTAEALAHYLLKEICEKLRKSNVSTSEISGVELTLWEGYERGVVARGNL